MTTATDPIDPTTDPIQPGTGGTTPDNGGIPVSHVAPEPLPVVTPEPDTSDQQTEDETGTGVRPYNGGIPVSHAEPVGNIERN